MTPLQHAAYRGSYEICRMLIDHVSAIDFWPFRSSVFFWTKFFPPYFVNKVLFIIFSESWDKLISESWNKSISECWENQFQNLGRISFRILGDWVSFTVLEQLILRPKIGKRKKFWRVNVKTLYQWTDLDSSLFLEFCVYPWEVNYSSTASLQRYSLGAHDNQRPKFQLTGENFLWQWHQSKINEGSQKVYASTGWSFACL
jgi:hypothetical protein